MDSSRDGSRATLRGKSTLVWSGLSGELCAVLRSRAAAGIEAGCRAPAISKGIAAGPRSMGRHRDIINVCGHYAHANEILVQTGELPNSHRCLFGQSHFTMAEAIVQTKAFRSGTG